MYVHGGKFHATLTGPVRMMRELAHDILRATGGITPECAVGETPRVPAPKRGSRLHPDRLAAYERVAARVKSGATWSAASQAEGVNLRAAYNHLWQQAKRRGAARSKEARA